MPIPYLITKLRADEWRRTKVIANAWQSTTTTMSTAFWALAYDMLPEIGLFSTDVEKQLLQLKNGGLVEFNESGLVRLTSSGLAAQADYRDNHYVPQHLQINLMADVRAFQDVFLLVNQSISELAHHNAKFYPYQIDLRNQWQVKAWLKAHPREELINAWREALTTWLVTQDELDADLFAATLFGYEMNGQLLQALPGRPEWVETDWLLWQLDCFASLMTTGLEQQNIIGELVGLVGRDMLSESNVASIQMWQQGQSFEQVAHSRRLKLSTIREHILRGAMFRNWTPEQVRSIVPPAERMKLFETFDVQPFDQWVYKDYANGDDPIFFMYFRLFQIAQIKERAAKA
ncbi:hypothetical protein EQG49_12960 [Periweissella cryptocerci]|uniref:Helicase Helix-turn-helix domain-containing protein n=1 Tax=Periweissella cryptocerci TaxID=2506420 RepID=A0A4P6YWX7_9LACO|nr:helix-turn-helix domain-containing protein [Periweissella cryptocerci]QBO37306.1 hypothetical protein EQG49_12960 [Periweissella cryptocerci]